MARLPTYGPMVSLGGTTETFSELNEISGMGASRQNPGVLWLVNDATKGGGSGSIGGTPPEIYPLAARRGTLPVLGRYFIGSLGGGNEDMSIGPGPGGSQYVYVGVNMGGKGGDPGGSIARVPEPTIAETAAYQGTGGSVPISGGVRLQFAFSDGSLHSVEAFMIDPITNAIYIICKGLQNNDSETGKVYKYTYAQQLAGGTASIDLVADLGISWRAGSVLQVTHDDASQSPPRSQVTSCDISQDGQWIVVRTRSQDAWIWRRPAGGTIEDAWGSGSASSRDGAGGKNILLTSGQESVCFATFKNDTQGSSADDGVPGGIYGIAEGGNTLYYTPETTQPDSGGTPPWTMEARVPVR